MSKLFDRSSYCVVLTVVVVAHCNSSSSSSIVVIRTAEMLVSPLGIDAMTVTLRRERSDSRTQTLTITSGVTSRQTYKYTVIRKM